MKKFYVIYKSANGKLSGRSRTFKTERMANVQAQSLAERGYKVFVTDTEKDPLPTHTKKMRHYSPDKGETLIIV